MLTVSTQGYLFIYKDAYRCWALENVAYSAYFPGPIPVSASAADVQTALNSLWSIKPDTVQVTKVDFDTGSEYTVVFNSRRGTVS